MITPGQLTEYERIANNATPGPWAVESCGEKGDGSDMVGIVFHPDDENCDNQLSGRLPMWDEEDNEIEYYRDELIAECEHRNRNSAQDAQHIATFSPDVVLKMVEYIRMLEAENDSMMEALLEDNT